jgi:uncharacterized repeat protein (TIGR01451 family)
MRFNRTLLTTLVFSVIGIVPASASAAAATPVPAWSIQSLSMPTNFTPGDESGSDRYQVFVTNSGGAATNRSPITITDTLPAGLTVKEVIFSPARLVVGEAPQFCHTTTDPVTKVSTVSCEVSEPVPPKREPARFSPGDAMLLEVKVAVPPTADGTLINRVEVAGGGAEQVIGESKNQVSGEDAKAGFEEFSTQLTGVDGRPITAADAHPYEYTTSFGVNMVPTPPGSAASFVPAQGDLRQVEVALPPGLIGNPTAIPRCSAQDFTTIADLFSTYRGSFVAYNECPLDTAVGLALVEQLEGEDFFVAIPIYNLVPPKGMPAQFGFDVVNGPVYIDTKVRSDKDDGITAFLDNVTEAKRISAARFMLWGTPWDSSHDRVRGVCAASWETCPVQGEGLQPSFLRAPSECDNQLAATMSFTTWSKPVTGASATSIEPAMTECALPPFTPTITAKPSTSVADSPAGLHFSLHLPQKEHEDPEGLGEADLRDVKVTLPQGLVVNPSSADGRSSCSPMQVGLTTAVGQVPAHFNESPATCPAASKLGTVEAVVPAVDHPLKGSVYLAEQEENPFGSLLAFYVVLEDEQTGIVVKLPAKVSPDPVTGQLTTMVQESPQVPVEDFKFDFFEGSRAPLRTPATCGSFSTTTSLTPWTSPEGMTATPFGSFQVVSAPGGGSCPTSAASEPNVPSFEAGTVVPVAGGYSPLVVHLDRGDGSQSFSRLDVTLPPGATGKLAGIPECSEAQIAQAQARSHPGEGAVEQADPSCPSSSLVGTVTVGAGAGPRPLYVMGKAYLAGPYGGAPFSLVIVTPAIAGPFDLGTVVVRAGLFVNPITAQVTTRSDPLPSILDGIPLDVRSIAVTVDRSGFFLNPTNCNALVITGEEVSTLGQTAPLSGRFQVGACQGLKFTPKFMVSTTGKTSKANGASLTVKVAYPAGSVGSQTNLGRVDLQLPKQLPARLSTLQKACTEAQFNANPAGCPVASMIGTAKAITPLLSSPLTGPAILVSHGGAAFPDVEFLLQGEGVLVVLDGKTQIKKGITYSHFETLPDQPISQFETTLPQGPYSVLATNLPASAKNSLCGQSLTLPTTLTAQDGAVINQTTKATVTGCAKTKTLTRAQKLTLALKACHKQHNHAKRKACEHQARKKYGTVVKKAKKKQHV